MLAERTIRLTTPLDDDALLLQSMTGSEQLGRMFQYDLELLSENGNIAFDEILGQTMTVTMDLPTGGERNFHGHVSRFSYVGTQGELAHYRATLRPWLWFLTRSADCRIFQRKTVPDIVKEVFREHGFSDLEDSLQGSYREWDYCVQYRETDFDFISRLLEQEGIYYYCKHEKDKHTVVLADAYGSHEQSSGYEEVPFYPPDQMDHRERDHVSSWNVSQEVQPGTYAINDFSFKKPKAGLGISQGVPREHDHAEYEIYDYPGEYSENADGEHYARVRIEELHSQFEQAGGAGDVAGLFVGALFELIKFPRDDQNREYLVTTTNYRLEQNAFSSGKASSEPVFECSFSVIDAQQPFRAARITPKPVVQGPQTAIVVGPAGEAIATDEYGRVKVQFHWDRYGGNDENSSCWVRVSQNWAGSGWGGMFCPHIGHEVIVEFLEGDPDRPIITGRVYNHDNMPPKELPGSQTQSVIRDHGDNEWHMEGADGEQFIHLHQSCGNEVLLEDGGGSPKISVKQECGNEMVMDGSGGSEKVTIKDKFGNEVCLDSAAESLKISSPNKNSWLELGKNEGIKQHSDGDWYNEAIGARKVSVTMGVTEEFFAGAKTSQMVGVEIKHNASKEFSKNVLEYERKAKKKIKFDSQEEIEAIGGSGDESTLNLKASEAKLESKGTKLTLFKAGSAIIDAKKNIELKSPKAIKLGKKVVVDGKGKKVDLKNTKVMHKNLKVLG